MTETDLKEYAQALAAGYWTRNRAGEPLGRAVTAQEWLRRVEVLRPPHSRPTVLLRASNPRTELNPWRSELTASHNGAIATAPLPQELCALIRKAIN